MKQEKAESRFPEHRGETEKLLHASLCVEPIESGVAGILDEGRCEENLWRLVVEEVFGVGGETYEVIRLWLQWGEPDFGGGQPAVFDSVPL